MVSFALLALASIASSAHALVIPRSTVPPTYAVGYLEDYHTYHARYLALNCQGHARNGTFFSDCCHPMLATENLRDNRKPYCTPSEAASSSAAQAEPTSTVIPSGDDDDDCEDDDDDDDPSAAEAAPTSPAPLPESSAAEPSPSHSASPSPTPSPSSSEKPKPSPTSSSEAKSASSSSADKPKPSSSAGSTDGLGAIIGEVKQGGIGTFFYQNGVAGNCGTVHKDTDMIVALPSAVYDNGAHCGKTVVIQDVTTGQTAEAVVADSCPTCDSSTCLDFSVGLFSFFTKNLGVGTLKIKWGFKQT